MDASSTDQKIPLKLEPDGTIKVNGDWSLRKNAEKKLPLILAFNPNTPIETMDAKALVSFKIITSPYLQEAEDLLTDKVGRLKKEAEKEADKKRKDAEKVEKDALKEKRKPESIETVIIEKIFEGAKVKSNLTYSFPALRGQAGTPSQIVKSRIATHLLGIATGKDKEVVGLISHKYLLQQANIALDKLKDKLMYDIECEEYCNEVIGRVLDHFTDPYNCKTSRELNIAAFKHMLWQVLVKLYGIEHRDFFPLVFFFYGSQELGKSTFFKCLFQPLIDEMGSFSPSDLGDQFKKKSISKKLVSYFDEMATLTEKEYNNFKKQISEEHSSYRPMHVDSMEEVDNQTTFFCASNLPLSECAKDGTGLRRFFQLIGMLKRPDDITNYRLKLPLFEFDFVKVYKGINPNKPSPLTSNPDLKAQLITAQEGWETTNIISSYIKEYGYFIRQNDTHIGRETSLIPYDTIYKLIARYYTKQYSAKYAFSWGKQRFLDSFNRENITISGDTSKRIERLSFLVDKELYEAKDSKEADGTDGL